MADRFWAKVQRGDESACWPWTAWRLPSGYGTFGRTTAHRVAYELAFGPVPDGQVVMHACDNPPCCNPAHLRAGTQSENLDDMRAKGRERIVAPRGEQHWKCKLDDVEVDIVRALYASGEMSQQAIAARLGVGQTQISRIVRGENRKAA